MTVCVCTHKHLSAGCELSSAQIRLTATQHCALLQSRRIERGECTSHSAARISSTTIRHAIAVSRPTCMATFDSTHAKLRMYKQTHAHAHKQKQSRPQKPSHIPPSQGNLSDKQPSSGAHYSTAPRSDPTNTQPCWPQTCCGHVCLADDAHNPKTQPAARRLPHIPKPLPQILSHSILGHSTHNHQHSAIPNQLTHGFLPGGGGPLLPFASLPAPLLVAVPGDTPEAAAAAAAAAPPAPGEPGDQRWRWPSINLRLCCSTCSRLAAATRS